MKLAYITHPECLLHDMGPHPEQPARLNAIAACLRTTGIDRELSQYEAPLVDRTTLEKVHEPEYVSALFSAAPSAGLIQVDPDTAMNPHSLPAALRAAGAAQKGVDLVLTGEANRAFCAVRPPGHHAERGRAMGFCLFNNVAVAALCALEHQGLERVAILDFDVHHGNGTEDIVQGNERILFCSTFQHPFYPFSGAGETADNVVNTPLAAGSDGRVFRTAIETHWLPRVAEFAPQLIIVSAGFDAHTADDMAGLDLVEDDYDWVTRRICELAEHSAGGRIVSCLEGGYNLPALAGSVASHLQAMLETS